ncbi:hypothetical protein HaLaN_03864 [Haematococcus lacustris]|uniref:Uncharacterized protein n=1 Tax=Haematococcus lacustris TaxID=44745 RepID=A0A699YFK6_HAELA|nr:hypothetical protein HaLaN_03864 [Haematococcus lacustris]
MLGANLAQTTLCTTEEACMSTLTSVMRSKPPPPPPIQPCLTFVPWLRTTGKAAKHPAFT